MKTLIIILLFSITANAQGWFDEKYTQVTATLDPAASIGRSGLHIGAELERVEGSWGAKAFVQYFPQIEGSYSVVGAAMGVNFTLDQMSRTRVYAQPKLQMINRGGQNYGSGGADLGIERVFDGWSIGARVSFDWRTDFDWWGGKAKLEPGCTVTLSKKL